MHAAAQHTADMAKVQPLAKRRPPRHFIKEWRLYRGYTQEQLAEMTGVTHGALSQLERGLVNYTQTMLEALAVALRCEPADLIMRDPNSELWSVWDNVRRMPADDQERLTAIIEAFRKYR